MKRLLILLAFLCCYGPLFTQSIPSGKGTFTLERIVNEPFYPSSVKMMCGVGDSPITIVSCDGEDPSDGDNNPANGAFMTWSATGSNNFYYSRIYNGLDTFQIVFGDGSNRSVFMEVNGTYEGNLAIGGSSTNQCLAPGTWTVQVWDVMDANGDFLPDRDANGAIIGCFQECVFNFEPSCPINTDPRFDAETTEIGCGPSGGRIRLTNFQESQLYCTDGGGGGSTISWTGPGGYTGTGTDNSGLAAGTYVIEVIDFYGCISRRSVDLGNLAALAIDCSAATTPPTTVGGNDGMAEVNITSGTGNYTISWTGPVSGSDPFATNGVNIVNGLAPGTYTITVRDDDSQCEETCTVTVVDPPCTIDFTATRDPITGDITITVLSGIPNYQLAWIGPTSMPPFGNFGNEGITLEAFNFIPGIYEFVLIEVDRFECQFGFFVTVPEIDCSDLDFTVVEHTQISCGGADDGVIEISFTGDHFPVLNWTGPGVDGSGDTRLTDLEPGTYSFELFDSRNCMRDSSFTITAPPLLTLDCGAVRESLAALDDGKIGYRLAGGVGPYTISYTATDADGNPLPPLAATTTATMDTLRDLAAGTYLLTVTDANDCTTTCTAEVTEPNCTITASCIAVDPVAAGDPGALLLSFGGTPGFNVSITGPKDTTFLLAVNAGSVPNLPEGDYTLTVFNAEGCVGNCSFSIAGVTCDLAFTGLTTNPTCAGGGDGEIALDISGAAGGLTIDWNVDALDGLDTVLNLPAGSYTVMISDETGCPVAPQTFTLTDPDAVDVQLSQPFEIACNGSNTGSISTLVTGGTTPYTFTWSVDSLPDAPTVMNLAAGTYHLLVTDVNGCEGRDTIEIAEPPTLTMACSATGESAAGATDGTITVGSMGGAAGAMNVVRLSGDLGPVDITAGVDTTFSGLAPGTYNLTITDANGCTTTCTTIISQGGCDIAVDIMPMQPDCDNALGSATAMVTDANGMATFAWSSGQTTAAITGLSAGDYSVTVTDELGCEVLANVTINEFTDIPSVTFPPIIDVCDDGCATFEYTLSGTAPFLLDLELRLDGVPLFGGVLPIATDGVQMQTVCPAMLNRPNLEGLSLFIASVTDANGCSRPVNGLAMANVFPAAVSTFDTTICEGTDLDYFGEVFNAARPTGDVVVPTPSVNGCDSTVSVTVSFFAPAISTLDTMICEGTELDYFGEVFNAARPTGDVVVPTPSVNGCDSTVSVTVSFFAPAIGTFDTIICEGTDLDYFGEVFNAARPVGDVVVPTPSVNGCDSTVTVRVSFSAPAISTLDTMICEGTELDYFGEVFNAARPMGNVVIPIPSVNGCDSTVSVSVSFFAPAISTLDTMICEGTELDYFGEVFNAARPMGNVVIPIPSVNGCDSTVSVSVSFFAPAISTLDTMICEGTELNYFGEVFNTARPMGEVVVPTPSVNGCDSTVSVNVTFFTPATSTLDTMICEGADLDYFGEVFNAARPTGNVVVPTPSVNGCDSMVSVTLSFFAPALGAFDTTICAGTELNYFGELFDASRTQGDVTLPILAANGCDSTVSVSLGFFPQAAGSIDTTICPGDVFVFAGRDFTEAVTDQLLTLPVPTANGCDSVVAVTVRVRQPGNLILTGDGVACADGSFFYEVNNQGEDDVTFALNISPGEIQTVPGGTTLRFQAMATVGTLVELMNVSSESSCPPAVEGAFTISETDLGVAFEVMSGDSLFAVSCAGGDDGEVAVLATGGLPPYTYAWRDGTTDSTRSSLTEGSFTVVVESGRGCSASGQVVLTAPNPLVAVIGEVETSCLDSLPGLILRDLQGGVEPYLYQTDANRGFESTDVLPDTILVTPGGVDLVLEDANGCRLERSFVLDPAPTSTLTVIPDRAIIAQGDSVELLVRTDLNTSGFLLSPGPDLPIPGNRVFVSPMISTDYLVTAVDSAGCSASAEVTVFIDDFVPVYAPTAFSPNGDGRNDIFRVFGRRTVVAFENFNIFDRWGDLVYVLDGPIDPRDQNWGWDGRNAAGQTHEPAVYVFTIDVLLADGRRVTIKSDMVLMR